MTALDSSVWSTGIMMVMISCRATISPWGSAERKKQVERSEALTLTRKRILCSSYVV
ncbi:hypothetical protein DAI22_06g179500 [Oryza sativa Japonica Group]|nr:hypothetical protein DAI22_06g179500 [Oryza sativa Japonica Group]